MVHLDSWEIPANSFWSLQSDSLLATLVIL